MAPTIDLATRRTEREEFVWRETKKDSVMGREKILASVPRL